MLSALGAVTLAAFLGRGGLERLDIVVLGGSHCC